MTTGSWENGLAVSFLQILDQRGADAAALAVDNAYPFQMPDP
jgi:hypothetical protein